MTNSADPDQLALLVWIYTDSKAVYIWVQQD